MTKKAKAKKQAAEKQTGEKQTGIEVFSFGDPEPVLSRATLLDMLECVHTGRWYEPPLSLNGLARAFRASPHHSSAIFLKRNMLAASYVPNAILSRADFSALVLDYLVFGNAYVEEVRNRLGGLMRADHLLAKYVRRGVEADHWWWVPGWQGEANLGRVHQLRAPDINQEIYGIPEYISSLQSALLNENATLFRRRYFENGSHAGYILYATGEFTDGDVDAMRDSLQRAKGPGNFRNLFVHSPNGKESGIRLLPIAEVGAKDDFQSIKSTTRDDVLAAHRVPPQLLGIVPSNTGGFGDVTKAADAFYELEIMPLQAVFLQLNEALRFDLIRFIERASPTE